MRRDEIPFSPDWRDIVGLGLLAGNFFFWSFILLCVLLESIR